MAVMRLYTQHRIGPLRVNTVLLFFQVTLSFVIRIIIAASLKAISPIATDVTFSVVCPSYVVCHTRAHC